MRVGIIGAGMVGSASAYAMVLMGACSELVLVDVDAKRARAEAQDIAHATPFSRATKVWGGDYDDLKAAHIIVLACGVGQRPGETRLELLARNAAVFREVIVRLQSLGSEPLLIVASNPVDVMTQVAQRLSGWPRERVIGTGTLLDSARFRSLLGAHFEVSPKSIHAHVLGEHGDSEVLAWSAARVGGVTLAAFAAQKGISLDEAARARIDHGVRRAAYTIIEGKGATWFGIGAGVSRLVESIGRQDQAVYTVSMVEELDAAEGPVAFSLPRVVGARGIEATLHPDLHPDEANALEASKRVLRAAWKGLPELEPHK